MEFDTTVQKFILDQVDRDALGRPEVPGVIDVSEAQIYLERTEVQRAILLDSDPTKHPFGSNLSEVRSNYHKHMKALFNMTVKFGAQLPSPVADIEAFLGNDESS